MKNKKLIKAIAATVVCSAMGITAFSFAACDPDDSGDTGHRHSYTWVDDENGTTHHRHCSVDGCDAPDTASVNHVDNDQDNVCDRCGGEVASNEVKYDLITTSVDFKAAANEVAGAETTSDQTVGKSGYTYGGKFFFSEGSKLEPGNNCVNTQKKDVTITLGGVTNSIKIVGKGASGTAGDVILKNESGTAIDTATSTGNGVPIALSGEDLPAGVYTIVSETSVRLTEITITEKLEQSEATGISVTASNIDFLINSDFSANGLTVVLNYKNGRKDTLASSDYEVTQSVDKTKAGKYTVTVKYKENEEFTATYNVYYYTIDSIEQSTIGYDGSKQVTLQQAVITDGTLSSNYLTVKGTGTVEGRTHSFNLPTSALNVQLPAVTAEGEVTVNYSVDTSCTTGGKTLDGSYKVMVKNAVSAVDNKVEVTVGESGDFKTLTQAVQFLKACNLDASVNKIIKLQAGTYTEKVWLDMDNVTLVGLGDKIDDTKLTYSLVEGDADLYSGSLWALNCATLHVTGKNFKAYKLAIRNDFDYIHNADKYSGNQGPQGVALTLEGDGNVLYNCHLYGNQDTLYLKSGRSYFYKTQIDGNVDFIFGSNKGIAYFEECKIVAISRGKSENGHVAVPQHDEDSKPKYGYVFDNCEFTDDGDVAAGGMTLGRPWGKKATVAYINCSFTAAYAQKFVDMSGNTPADADFWVYGSTNANETPITGAPVGGKVLTEEQAANYTKANTFGASNTKNYTTAFDWAAALNNLEIFAGIKEGEVTKDPVKTYDLLGYTYGENNQLQGATGEYQGIKIDATNGKFANRGTDIQINAGTILYIPVEENYAVSVIDYNNNELGTSSYSIGYVDLEEVHYAKITFDSCFIKSISVNTAKTVTLYSVSFNLNGATGTAPEAQSVISGGKLLSVSDPVWDGHTFNGWYTAATGGEKVNLSSYTVTTDGVTLYAQWTEGEVAKEAVLIEEAKNFNFGKGSGTLVEYVTNSEKVVDGLLINGTTAAHGDWTTINANTTITLKVKSGLAVEFTIYNSTKYEVYIDGVKQTITATGTDNSKAFLTVVAQSSDVEITLKCTGADYIGEIKVS